MSRGRCGRPTGRLLTSWAAVAGTMFGVGWGANQFASLLLAYHQHRGLTVGTDEALFGIYALGLVPALLLGGPASDRYGRSRLVRPAALVSVLATAVLISGSQFTVALYLGRFLAGAVSGVVFAAGTAWVKELSVPPYDLRGGEQAGARRAAIALSAGFGLGPLVSGLLAQWGPFPLVVPYLAHLLVMALILPLLWRAPETVQSGGDGRPALLSRLWVDAASHPRFLTVVAPLAPWVFGAPVVAFAVLPSVVRGHTQGFGIAFAGAAAGVTMGVSVLVQPIARRLDRVSSVRGAAAGLGSVIAGMLVAAAAAVAGSPLLVLAAAVVLGAGCGLCLVSGLLEVQRLAGAGELAGLTAVYYALTYVGFAVPLILAELAPVLGYPGLLICLAFLAALSLVTVRLRSPRSPAPEQGR